MPSEKALAAATEIVSSMIAMLEKNDLIPAGSIAKVDEDVQAQATLIDRHFPNADLNEKFVRETAAALHFMHEDPSLGLKLGDRFHIEGIAALKKQRDDLQVQIAAAAFKQVDDYERDLDWKRVALRSDVRAAELEKALRQANDIIGNQAGEARWMQDKIDRLEKELAAIKSPGPDPVTIGTGSIKPPGIQTVDRTGEALGCW